MRSPLLSAALLPGGDTARRKPDVVSLASRLSSGDDLLGRGLGAQALAGLTLELGTEGSPGGRGACRPVSSTGPRLVGADSGSR